MPDAASIPWNDLPYLRAIRLLGNLINRRWGMGLSFLTPRGTLVEGRPERGYLSYTQACPAAPTADGLLCAEEGRRLWRSLAEAVQAAAGNGALVASLVHTCHATVRVLVAPLILDDRLLGGVVAGGYHLTGTDRPDPARSAFPRLDPAEEDFLTEVVGSVAREVRVFADQFQGRKGSPRRGGARRQNRYSYDEIIGESRPMQQLYGLLDKVIDSDSTVLIQGENGTGKELIARAIHFNSRRKNRRFVVQNCSAFNDNLLDSELFGHKKGSFTGAISDKQGLFEVADGSTFFLDEIGDMSPSLQVKLLRVLQEGTFIPVGGTQPKKVDVRIIAATNRDLKKMVERGEFREDLYYRINVINIGIPPLRERKEDIAPLVDHFLGKHGRGNGAAKRILKSCMVRLMEYNWPGNIRELENEIERMVVLAGDQPLVGEDLLSSRIARPLAPGEGSPEHNPHSLPEAVENLERTLIFEVLKRHRWNKTRAAQELQISRRNLIRKVNKYQLDQRRAAGL